MVPTYLTHPWLLGLALLYIYTQKWRVNCKTFDGDDGGGGKLWVDEYQYIILFYSILSLFILLGGVLNMILKIVMHDLLTI